MLENGIDAIEIEITNRCNAACPMCARTNNDIVLSNQSEISFKDFKKFFPVDFLKNLKQIKFCGNYGDPAISKDIIIIHQYVLDVNPDIKFILSTNGGVRSISFWRQLGEIYAKTPKSHVQFHIDGLEDTNHIYRVGVKWKKVMENAKEFIAAGGNAMWFYIPFFHNEHQVEEAEQLSNQLGFSDFILKVSARFNDFKKPFSDGKVKIYPPVADRFNIEKMQVKLDLKCVMEERKELYIDSWGRLFPCCWTASRYHKHSWNVKWNLDDVLSLHKHSLQDVINNKGVNEWINSLYKDTSSICHMRCTGSHIHVLEKNGIKRPQKDLWYYGDKNVNN